MEFEHGIAAENLDGDADVYLLEEKKNGGFIVSSTFRRGQSYI